MKTKIRENWCQSHLANPKLYPFFEKIDLDLAEREHAQGCCFCKGKLHRANYKRKPRGTKSWPEEPKRYSFCCDQEGCRRRHTPPSVRFMGRRVYAGFVVVLVSAMAHGLKPQRVAVLRQTLGIDRRTLERWYQWWLGLFVESAFWRAARARFMPPLCQKIVPLSLCLSFEVQRRDRLLDLLQFLAPITTPTAWKELVM